MKTTFSYIAGLVVALVATAVTQAQPPGGGPGGPPPMDPGRLVLEALDANGDHEIDATEMENAAKALKSLDRNGDGRLSPEDIEGPEGDRGGPGQGNRGRRAGRESGPGGPPEILDRIKSFDKNNDGKITQDELPERMQRMMERLDANDDGAIDGAELEAIGQRMQRGQGPGGFGPQGGPGGRGPGPGGPGGRGPGMGGPPSPEQFVEHAMEFDANGDGMLDREELAEDMERAQS